MQLRALSAMPAGRARVFLKENRGLAAAQRAGESLAGFAAGNARGIGGIANLVRGAALQRAGAVACDIGQIFRPARALAAQFAGIVHQLRRKAARDFRADGRQARHERRCPAHQFAALRKLALASPRPSGA